jgi:hypothetical protein
MTGRGPYGLAVADFDGDDAIDLATAGDYSADNTSEVSVLLQSP